MAARRLKPPGKGRCKCAAASLALNLGASFVGPSSNIRVRTALVPGGLRHAHTVQAGCPSALSPCTSNPREVPRIDALSLQPGHLVSSISHPAVLVNLAECWPARHCWSRSYLACTHGDLLVAKLRLPADVFETDGLLEPERANSLYADHARNAYVPYVRPLKPLRLRELIGTHFDDYYFEIGENGAAGRLCFDAFGSPERAPALLARDDLTQLTFGMGPAGDGVMFHAHTATWNALMYGSKDWYFFNPDEFRGELYDRLAMLEARAIPQELEALASDNKSAYSGDSPTASAIPSVMKCTQRPGEVIYIPDGWWHATFSNTETACLGGQRHKDRLPDDWADQLYQHWSGCGLALNALAKKRGDAALFEATIQREPYNLRFVMDHMSHLGAVGNWNGFRLAAAGHRGRMLDVRRRGLLARVELAAIFGQLAESMYHAVEAASAAAVAKAGPGGLSMQVQEFRDALGISHDAYKLMEEALTLDPGNPIANALSKAIETRANSAVAQQRVQRMQAPPQGAASLWRT